MIVQVDIFAASNVVLKSPNRGKDILRNWGKSLTALRTVETAEENFHSPVIQTLGTR